MKKVLFILLMAITSMMASADVGEWSLGGQFVFGTKGSMPGVGLKLQSNLVSAVLLSEMRSEILQQQML